MTSPFKRLWYPAALVDEDLPDGRESPEAWLNFLQAIDADDEVEDQEEQSLARLYAPGDEIPFHWMERRGFVTLRIHGSGTLHTSMRCADTPDMFEPEVSAAVNQLDTSVNSYWHNDSEIYAETAEEFAEYWTQGGIANWDEFGFEEVEVDTAIWSPEIRFRISADGKTLMPVESMPNPAITEAEA